METFKIEVQEFLARVIEIQAESLEEAISIVNTKYENEEIVLDYNDYLDFEIGEFKE